MASDNEAMITGIEELQRTIQAMILNLSDLRVHKEPLQKSFHETEREQFDTQGGLSGGWQPLSPWYQAWKDRAHPGLTMLVLSGRMMRSLTSLTGDSIFNITQDHVEVGTNVEHAAKHQYGDVENPRLPIRPVIPEEVALNRMADALEDSILEKLNRVAT